MATRVYGGEVAMLAEGKGQSGSTASAQQEAGGLTGGKVGGHESGGDGTMERGNGEGKSGRLNSMNGPVLRPDGDDESGLSAWQPGFVETWSGSTPQRTIFKRKLPRDRWVPLPVPKDLGELIKLLRSETFAEVWSDPQKRNYWIYATGRTLYFFLSSFTNNLLQIQIAPDPDPVRWGKKFRVEVASALKRVAMSGSRPDVVDTQTRIPSADRVRKLFGSIFELYRRDCNNIYYGVYRSPYDASLRHRQFNFSHVKHQFETSLRASIETGTRRKKGRDGMIEMRNVLLRREAEQASGVVVVDDDRQEDEDLYNDLYLIGDVRRYPRYYLQNFHWQTDGWLSSKSAKSYEYTTESLFSGVQDAMQRAGFVSVSEFVTLRRGKGVEEENIKLLEVACGTGRLHTFLKDNWPQMDTVMSDLSPFYLKAAQDNMEYFIDYTLKTTGRVIRPPSYVHTKAEDMPFEDNTFEIITCVYLFHEIPMKIRHRVAEEMFRVVKPGGIVVITDSFQRGDQPDKDHVGALFPQNYHEPFYTNYFEDTDLVGVFLSKGFTFKRHQIAHLSKVLTFEKPGDDDDEDGTTTLRRGGGTWAIV